MHKNPVCPCYSRPVNPVASGPHPGFIVRPLYDVVHFIGAPVWALAIGVLMADTAIATEPVTLFGHSEPVSDLFIGSFIMAHLALVMVRSHANPAMFKQFPVRFGLFPIVLLTVLISSMSALVVVTVIATWWDVYHSSLQTFGLGRLYDRAAGNPTPPSGDLARTLDKGLNLVLYMGPILAGATLMDHLDTMEDLADIGWLFLGSVPARTEAHQAALTNAIAALGGLYLLVYVLAYIHLYRQGYALSVQKIVLYVSTGAVSLYAWGFNSFGEAFFVMNLFHAWQYFAIVWWSENRNLRQILRVENRRFGTLITLGLFIGAAAAYGVFAHTTDASNRPIICVTLTVSIMHFWYDGFIWSVRKQQV